jgi:hypothetical protein
MVIGFEDRSSRIIPLCITDNILLYFTTNADNKPMTLQYYNHIRVKSIIILSRYKSEDDCNQKEAYY